MTPPASVGSSSRRSGGAARSQREMATIASASPTVALNADSNRSMTFARSGVRLMSKTFSLPGGKGRKSSQTSCSTTVPKAKAPMIA